MPSQGRNELIYIYIDALLASLQSSIIVDIPALFRFM